MRWAWSRAFVRPSRERYAEGRRGGGRGPVDRVDREALVRTVQRLHRLPHVRQRDDQPLLRVNVFLTLLEVRK